MYVLLVEPDVNSAAEVGNKLSSSIDAEISVASPSDALSVVAKSRKPDVALVAWDERGSAARLVSELKKDHPQLPIVLMLAEGVESQNAIFDALGVQGKLSKLAPASDLSRVLQEVAKRDFEGQVLTDEQATSDGDRLPGWLSAVSNKWRTNNPTLLPGLARMRSGKGSTDVQMPASLSEPDLRQDNTPVQSDDIPSWLPAEFTTAQTWLSPDTITIEEDEIGDLPVELAVAEDLDVSWPATHLPEVELSAIAQAGQAPDGFESLPIEPSTAADVEAAADQSGETEIPAIDWVGQAARVSALAIKKIIGAVERIGATASDTPEDELTSDAAETLVAPPFSEEPELSAPPETLIERVMLAREARGLPEDFVYSTKVVSYKGLSTATAAREAPAGKTPRVFQRMTLGLAAVALGLILTGTLLARAVSGSGPGQPDVQTMPAARMHSNSAVGVAMGLPEGWRARDVQASGIISPDTQLILAAEREGTLDTMQSALGEGAFVVDEPVLVGIVTSRSDLSGADPRDLLDVFMSEGLVEDFRLRSMRTVRLGDTYGLQANFSGTNPSSNDRIKGRIIAVTWAEQSGFFIGAAPAGDWRTFSPTFDEIAAFTELSSPAFAEENAPLPSLDPVQLTGGDGRETSEVWQIVVNGDQQQWLMEDGNYAHNWTFTSGENWTVTITVRTLDEEFDPILMLIGPDGSVLASDDDSGGGQWNRDAQLRTTLPAGKYVVRVHSFGDDAEGGEYTIKVTSP